MQQEVRRFELVRDLPIYAGVLLDTSALHGRGERREARRGGQAAPCLLRDGDHAQGPGRGDHLQRQADPGASASPTRWTCWPAALAGLTAEGNTALYDSLIYALYYFGGVKGKRAIILLSDGQDDGSHYSFNEALDYARRSGVAIYAVGHRPAAEGLRRPRQAPAAGRGDRRPRLLHRRGRASWSGSSTRSRRSCAPSTCSPTSPPTRAATTSSAPSR